jgi:hypothetical protein
MLLMRCLIYFSYLITDVDVEVGTVWTDMGMATLLVAQCKMGELGME